MGCGGSKLNPEQESVPARLRPILRRRLEEIRARRNGGPTNGLSKRELLAEGANEHSSSGQSSPDPSFIHTQDCPPTLQKITIDPSTNSSELSSNQEGGDGEEVKGKLGNDGITQIGGGKMGNVCGGEGDEERVEAIGLEEGGKEESASIDGDMVAPGSPSFRVYCDGAFDHIHSLAGKEEFDGYNDAGAIIDCERISTSEESISSNEISVKHTPKKGIRGMNFKKMIPKGGKTIFNIHSFYNFPCSSNNSHDNSHLLQKAAA